MKEFYFEITKKEEPIIVEVVADDLTTAKEKILQEYPEATRYFLMEVKSIY
jgi:hypothetical protein